MKIVFKIPYSDWDNFISSHPNGTVFQTPEIYEFFKTARRFDPLLLAAYDKTGNLCGILVGIYICEKKGIGELLSTRFVIYGGPLLTGSNETKKECLDLILKELVEQTRKKALFVQFRNYFSWEGYLPIFEKNGFFCLERLNYIIQVQGVGDSSTSSGQAPVQGVMEAIRGKMSESRRRQLDKALKSGAEIIEPESIDEIKEFYNILFKLYRNKIRKPLADWSFFENFYNVSKNGNLGMIRLVRYKGKIIGGILSPVFENKCIYEWYVCGLDKEYKEQYPSVLATWAALDYAINNNIETFDFMGVGKPDVPYGVRDFKARFGGELVNYGRLTRINNRFLYHIAELGYNVLALMKKI